MPLAPGVLWIPPEPQLVSPAPSRIFQAWLHQIFHPRTLSPQNTKRGLEGVSKYTGILISLRAIQSIKSLMLCKKLVSSSGRQKSPTSSGFKWHSAQQANMLQFALQGFPGSGLAPVPDSCPVTQAFWDRPRAPCSKGQLSTTASPGPQQQPSRVVMGNTSCSP